MGRDQDRRRTWEERAGEYCPGCGRSFDNVERADVHHRDGNASNGHPNNRRKRCKKCHFRDEHGRDVDSPKQPSGVRRSGPRRPSRSGPRR